MFSFSVINGSSLLFDWPTTRKNTSSFCSESAPLLVAPVTLLTPFAHSSKVVEFVVLGADLTLSWAHMGWRLCSSTEVTPFSLCLSSCLGGWWHLLFWIMSVSFFTSNSFSSNVYTCARVTSLRRYSCLAICRVRESPSMIRRSLICVYLIPITIFCDYFILPFCQGWYMYMVFPILLSSVMKFPHYRYLTILFYGI